MSESDTQFVGVDWSGAGPASAQRKAIWTAVVRDGVLCDLSNGRARAEVTQHLIAIRAEASRTIVGLDFAFSLPRWWMDEQGHASVEGLWRWAGERAAGDPLGWLRELPEPFWGTSFRLKPVGAFSADRVEFRRTELESKAPGATPMSTFRLFGPGTVGAQGLRGQPCLLALRDAGFAIWPFDPPTERLVIEVFPRLLVRRLSAGMEALNGDALRAAFVDATPAGFTGDGAAHASVLRANQDAFDAAVSAWALWFGRQRLDALSSEAPDEVDRLEGRIWSLPDGTASPLTPPADHVSASSPAGTDAELAALQAQFATRGHRLVVHEPVDSGAVVAVGIPDEGAAGVAPYARGATVLEAAWRALEVLEAPPA